MTDEDVINLALTGIESAATLSVVSSHFESIGLKEAALRYKNLSEKMLRLSRKVIGEV